MHAWSDDTSPSACINRYICVCVLSINPAAWPFMHASHTCYFEFITHICMYRMHAYIHAGNIM